MRTSYLLVIAPFIAILAGCTQGSVPDSGSSSDESAFTVSQCRRSATRASRPSCVVQANIREVVCGEFDPFTVEGCLLRATDEITGETINFLLNSDEGNDVAQALEHKTVTINKAKLTSLSAAERQIIPERFTYNIGAIADLEVLTLSGTAAKIHEAVGLFGAETAAAHPIRETDAPAAVRASAKDMERELVRLIRSGDLTREIGGYFAVTQSATDDTVIGYAVIINGSGEPDFQEAFVFSFAADGTRLFAVTDTL